uniref:Uncharacterized protein n=1 Tax=Oryza nivara TaxID=4536 RepID=A0A0E0J295_ORYNI
MSHPCAAAAFPRPQAPASQPLRLLGQLDRSSQPTSSAASPPYKNVPGSICSTSKKLLLHTQIPGLICSANKGVVPLPLLADLRCTSVLFV